MKYKLRGGIKDNLVELIYENRNVNYRERQSFLNPTNNDIMPPMVYKNMHEGFELLAHHVRNGHKITILVDSDTDGLCSGAMMYLYLRDYVGYTGVKYMLHEGRKAHGLSPEIMRRVFDDKPDLLIIPDAGSNDFKEHEILKNMSVDILVIDHHKTDRYSENAVVINNQLQEDGNKTLSGAGMVLKFLEYLDIMANLDGARNFYDLASIALVADAMDITHNETRYYVLEGLKDIRNPLLQTLIGDKEEKDFNTISYDVAPSLNVIIRIGSVEEQRDLFKALISEGEEIRTMKVKGKGEVEMTYTESVKLIADRLKAKQTRMIKKVLEDENTIVITQNLPFTIVIFEDEQYRNLSGLIASKIVDRYNKPAIVVCEKDDFYRGSGRSTNTFRSFRTYLANTKMCEYASGHESAFGVSISKKNLSDLTVRLLGTNISEDSHIVDKSYSDGYIPATDIFAISEMKHQWCKGFEEPLFHIKLTNIDKHQIQTIGTLKDTIKFKNNYITFIKFKCEQEEIDKLVNTDLYDLEIIGKFSVNEWMGRSYPQVIIEELEIKQKVDEKKFNFGTMNLFNT